MRARNKQPPLDSFAFLFLKKRVHSGIDCFVQGSLGQVRDGYFLACFVRTVSGGVRFDHERFGSSFS